MIASRSLILRLGGLIFLVKYGMQSNTWLQGLYDEKEKWVPIYLSHIFWAGMLSTQRSEGMHVYFDDYMPSRCSLKEFMEQYEVAIAPENDDDGVVEDVVQKFYVLDRSLQDNFRPGFTYKVEYRVDGEYLNCQCHRFEFRGLLCCRIPTVMTMKDIRFINERYILTRWRKDVYRRHSSIFF
ncbi:hypothetical protein ACS0TY_033390 [Phlomoides rotata]